MTIQQINKQIEKLDVDERVKLIEHIWESIEQDAAKDPDLTAEQKEELERRIKAYADHPEAWVSLEEINRQLRATKTCLK